MPERTSFIVTPMPLKIAIAQINATVGDFAGNASRLPPYEIVVHGAANMAAEELAYIRRAEAVFADARLAFGQQVYLRFA